MLWMEPEAIFADIMRISKKSRCLQPLINSSYSTTRGNKECLYYGLTYHGMGPFYYH